MTIWTWFGGFRCAPLRTAADYEGAREILADLLSRADAGLTRGESDYADVLSGLVRDYDQSHSSLRRDPVGRRRSPIQLLQLLVEEHGMNTTSLGKLVGGSGQASMLLHGKRELSKANIRALAEHFKISAAALL